MVEYWTKDTKVFKEVQNMPARTKIIAAYPSLSPAERQAADFILLSLIHISEPTRPY